MQLCELRLANVRNIGAARVELRAGVTEFVGANGAGKTSILEAVYMLSHGRSFRSARQDSVIRFGGDALDVFAVVSRPDRQRRIGLSRRRADWEARVDGTGVAALSDLLREVAVVCFEPGSHALISGPAEERRRFVDWALFHVEPEYIGVARRYRRALKQRNALLRAGGIDSDLDIWDVELARSAKIIDEWRSGYLVQLAERVRELAGLFVPELGVPELRYLQGWPAGTDMLETLRARRVRDRERAHTGAGPHRADWRIAFANAPEREHLSRGQEKLSAFICLLAQARLFQSQLGEWPILCVDDLASELDRAHQQRVLGWLDEIDAQVLITGVEALPRLELPHRQRTTFHVEQGTITTLL